MSCIILAELLHSPSPPSTKTHIWGRCPTLRIKSPTLGLPSCHLLPRDGSLGTGLRSKNSGESSPRQIKQLELFAQTETKHKGTSSEFFPNALAFKAPVWPDEDGHPGYAEGGLRKPRAQ